MDFKQIKTFLQVAEQGSFTRASDVLALSRAMVSIHIKQLEESLGVILLNRNTRQVELTEAGKSFYQDCQMIHQSYLEAVAKIQHNNVMLKGRLRIGLTHEFAIQFIVPIMTSFCQLYPNLALYYDVNSSVNDLIADQLDVVIRLGNLPDSALKSRKIGAYPIVLVATPAFMAQHPIKELSEILTVPWITQHQWQHHSFSFSHTKGEGGTPQQKALHFAVPVGQYQSNSAGLTHQMVLAGLGVTICPLWLVAQEINEGRLIQLFPEYQLPSQDIHILYLDQKPLPQKTRLVIDYLKTHCFS